jgi:hypothetical protein
LIERSSPNKRREREKRRAPHQECTTPTDTHPKTNSSSRHRKRSTGSSPAGPTHGTTSDLCECGCGLEVNQSGIGVRKRYSTSACKSRAWHRRRAGRASDQVLGRQRCRTCGETFQPRHRNQRFCCWPKTCKPEAVERQRGESKARAALERARQAVADIHDVSPAAYGRELRQLERALAELRADDTNQQLST